MGASKPDKKKEKKEKKRSEADGVSKPSSKKDKKDKKEKKDKQLKDAVLTAALDDKLQADAASKSLKKAPKVTAVETDDDDGAEVVEHLVGELVPFACPLADEKGTKKALKCVRKAAKAKTLKRGVKEVVKALRKSPPAGPTNHSFPGVAILAGDISPWDVISHIPVLCEDVNVPYIFVRSRAELGAASSTKRPTSVVMVMEKRLGGRKKADDDAAAAVKEAEAKDGGKGAEEDDAEAQASFAEAYKDLVKLVQKESEKQLKFS